MAGGTWQSCGLEIQQDFAVGAAHTLVYSPGRPLLHTKLAEPAYFGPSGPCLGSSFLIMNVSHGTIDTCTARHWTDACFQHKVYNNCWRTGRARQPGPSLEQGSQILSRLLEDDLLDEDWCHLLNHKLLLPVLHGLCRQPVLKLRLSDVVDCVTLVRSTCAQAVLRL